ncbi:arylamine N-acetyltransferase family protein [Yinghuangia seranimata]|uniref:arylamine N-acetyltransferase family protein n=1 Tax=Yinghuangia seranimata TaxID=408067 RepID=UPI00248BD951|nr:arylamine N-acetyltransferase [Yinghuangia seranimata]MDI2130064.1 arylamine N-acetyltransferase [Yinghuangia seranimata]
MDDKQVDAYLRRIGAERPARPDGAALRELHARHLRAVPFENLAIHLGDGVSLDEDRLYGKIVVDRRGGFCYELNGTFALLLTALGYDVELLAARVHGRDGLGPPYDHLALRVTAPGEDAVWLADVGFGRHSEYPLRFDMRGEQADPGGVFEIRDAPDGDLDVLLDGTPEYRMETRPRRLGDFEATCWWQCTSPKAHFTRSLVCSLPVDGGRITLSGRTLVTTDATGRHERELGDDAEVLAAYRDLFGISLDRVPTLGADG